VDRTPGNHLGDGYDYQIVVGAAVKKLRVRPVLTDSFASFAVLTACNCEQCNCAPQKNMYGGSVLDVDVDIPYGETTITVQVTAEDVSLKTNYTVRVLRKLLLSCTAAYMKGQGLPCSACSNSDGGRCGTLSPLTRGQRHTVENKCNDVQCDIVDSDLTPLPARALSGPGAPVLHNALLLDVSVSCPC
jgi:hypothetical protein